MFGTVTRDVVLNDLALLPVFPKVINLLLNALEDESADIATLSRHIQNDPVLTGRLLTLTNRLLREGGRDSVGDVGTAISLIGFERLRGLVLLTTLHVLNGKLTGSANNWSHALAVGISAQELARKLGVNPEWAMVAGLLHDVGQLWYRHFAPDRYSHVFWLMKSDGLPISEAELRVFGLDHGEVGAIIAEAWSLPENIVQAVRNHHSRGDQVAADKLIAIVHLSETLANALDLPYREENEVTTLNPAVFDGLGLLIDQGFVELLGRVQARYRFAEVFFSS